jgi:putative ABC transport system substrate-binding protein
MSVSGGKADTARTCRYVRKWFKADTPFQHIALTRYDALYPGLMGNMRRREFITLLGGAAAWWPFAALAQEAEKVRRIGFLRVGPPPTAFIDGFRRGMREQGLIENQHFIIEYSLAQNAAQLPDAAAELVRRRVDIIVASGTPSVLPAKDAAGQTPVVFVATLDPVATGLVASLARPGRNITGITSISGDLIAKRLQLTKELLPHLSRIAILVREASPTAAQYVQESRTAARNLDVELQILIERNPNDLDGIFVAVQGPSALVVADDAEFTARRAQIAELALRNQLPTVSGLREMVEAGGLMAYGASFGELYRRAASQVRRILQGANPANLPVEQPTKFEFVLNMRTAKALGLAIPPQVLVRADEVIE